MPEKITPPLEPLPAKTTGTDGYDYKFVEKDGELVAERLFGPSCLKCE